MSERSVNIPPLPETAPPYQSRSEAELERDVELLKERAQRSLLLMEALHRPDYESLGFFRRLLYPARRDS